MFRFLRSQFSPEQPRQDDLSDFFNYRQTTRSGFPNGACAIGVDKVLSLMAIGTNTGEIFILGGPNAMWRAQVPTKKAVGYIYFAHGTGTFMALCTDQSFHRFKITGATVEAQSIPPETRLKKITSCEMYQKKDLSDARLLIGTMTGNVFSIKMDNCVLSEFILYEDTIVPSLPDGMKGTSVDAISVNPKEPRQVILVIDQKCVLLYDINVHEVQKVFIQSSNVIHTSWCSDGVHFMLAHTDGGYSKISSQQESTTVPTSDPTILFGPFPCTPVNKVFSKTTKLGETLIFTGGLPRCSYGDRYTVTLKRGSRVAVLDFASPVVDFVLVPESNDHKSDEYTIAGYLLIFCEQELLMIDLADKNWKEVPLMYLHSLHFSQITTSTLCAQLEEHVWKEIHKASENQFKSSDRYSSRVWPFTAGNKESRSMTVIAGEESRQLLLTGHENGIVRLWAAGELTMRLLLTINTTKEFFGFRDDPPPPAEGTNGVRDSMYESDSSDENPTSEWPPFIKLGEYDIFCEDDKLVVQKIAFDSATGQIAVGGKGGHVLVYNLSDTAKKLFPRGCIDSPLVDLDKLPQHISKKQQLRMRDYPNQYEVGYQPYSNSGSDESVFIQMRPCTAVTAVTLLSSRGLVACANEFGFLVVDIRSKQTLVNCSMCSGQDLMEAGALDDALSRFKSMKKSIRQSFRRKKKTPTPATSSINVNAENANTPNSSHATPARALNGINEHDDDDEEILRPVERKIEARTERVSPEQPAWLIRVLVFAKATILSSTTASDCLWVGSNGGRILCYVIAPREKPEDSCRLVREIRLEHAAPIINIVVQADPFAKDSMAGTRLIVFTEEQIRAYSLPQLKNTRYKYKLTAMEGERIRKAGLVKLVSSTDRHVDELFAAVLTNQGNIILFSLINPRKKISSNVLKVTDIIGMTSCGISPSGELMFLRPGGCEYQRATISKQTEDYLSPFQSIPYPPPIEGISN